MQNKIILAGLFLIFAFCGLGGTVYAQPSCEDIISKLFPEGTHRDKIMFVFLDQKNAIPNAQNYTPKGMRKVKVTVRKDADLTKKQKRYLKKQYRKEKKYCDTPEMCINIDGQDIFLNLEVKEPYEKPYLKRIETEIREQLLPEVQKAFDEMQQSARRDGIYLHIISAFRNYNYQQYLYNNYQQQLYRRSRTQGSKCETVAKQGHSQHQLGTAIDINGLGQNFARTPEYGWLVNNAGKYGFSLSFPEYEKQGKDCKTGYDFEPWHWRYITPEGVEIQNDFFDGSQYEFLKYLKEECFRGNYED